jgi:hypothetical protein
MDKYLVSRLVREDYIIPAETQKQAIKTFKDITVFKDSSISDMVSQHNIQLYTDIINDAPILEIEEQ